MEEYREILDAERLRDGEALRQALSGLSQAKVPAAILSRLLLEEWHDLHEDLVFELGLIGDPDAVGAILKAATIPFEHLVRWGNLHEFQRKCAFALARIGTEDSRVALEALVGNQDPYIHKYGLEGLSNWPLPFRQP